jgi:hypothetical protein
MLLKVIYGTDSMVVGDNVVASFVVALASPFTLRDTVEERDFNLAETISRACWWQQARLPMYRYQIAMRIRDCEGKDIALTFKISFISSNAAFCL